MEDAVIVSADSHPGRKISGRALRLFRTRNSARLAVREAVRRAGIDSSQVDESHSGQCDFRWAWAKPRPPGRVAWRPFASSRGNDDQQGLRFGTESGGSSRFKAFKPANAGVVVAGGMESMSNRSLPSCRKGATDLPNGRLASGGRDDSRWAMARLP